MNVKEQHAPGMGNVAMQDCARRDCQLDLLRGVAVAGMFFFSVVGSLSDSLPALLSHNVPGQLLPGDFVLSLFLFCSGVSLAMVHARYPRLGDKTLWRKMTFRIGQMLLVGLFITPFSVEKVFGMDEMMLNAVLTIPALLAIASGRRAIWVTVVVIWAVHVALVRLQVIAPLPTEYLGGYSLAIFWLPMLLGGSLCYSLKVQEVARQLWIVLAALMVCIGFVGWPDKMSVNPAFSVLSVAVGVGGLLLLRRYPLRCAWLEYFGSKPLRMWILMFCLLGPLRLYSQVSLHRRQLGLSPLSAVLVSIAWMGCCFVISKVWDRASHRNT